MQPLRELGVRAGVLEQAAAALRELRAGPRRGDQLGPGAPAKAQVIEKARKVDYLGERDLAQRVSIACPTCGARTQGGKFCPECGAAVSQRKQCAHCGAQADGTPKFCPECGKPYGG